MLAEDYERSRSRTNSFDRLAKGLASGKVSRRGALKVVRCSPFRGSAGRRPWCSRGGTAGVAAAGAATGAATGAGQGRCPEGRKRCGPDGCCPESEVVKGRCTRPTCWHRRRRI